MAHTDDLSGNYRIEVSGWGLNDAFFVEKTELSWAEGGDKKLLLHHALLEGAIIFIRLVAPEYLYGSVPVAYQVGSVFGHKKHNPGMTVERWHWKKIKCAEKQIQDKQDAQGGSGEGRVSGVCRRGQTRVVDRLWRFKVAHRQTDANGDSGQEH